MYIQNIKRYTLTLSNTVLRIVIILIVCVYLKSFQIETQFFEDRCLIQLIVVLFLNIHSVLVDMPSTLNIYKYLSIALYICGWFTYPCSIFS